MDSYKELLLNAETITTRRADFRRDAGPVLSVDVKKQLRAVVRALARSAAIAEHKTAENEARTPNVTLRAVVYARFSSEKQRDRSIEDQVALCRDFCQRDGLSVVEVYEDRAISGACTANRLGWQRLMRDARAGRFDVVVAEALDRISRDQEDLAGIHKRLRFSKHTSFAS